MRSNYMLFAVTLLIWNASSFLQTKFKLQCIGKHGSRMTKFISSSADPENEIETSGKGFGKKVVLPVKEVASSDPATLPKSPAVGDVIRSSKTVRQMREEQLDAKIAELKEEEDLLASDPSVGAVPELVANRMITRISAFLGIPVFGGLFLFVTCYFISKKYDIVIPPMMVAYATQVPFIIGLVGITYGILSSSWDEAPGSLLGIDEFKINLDRIKEGLERTKNTAELKDDIIIEKEKLKRK
eukprot:gene11407-23866_t